MLKDKYKFKLSQGESISLYNSISNAVSLNINQKDLQIMLQICVLAEFYKRLASSLLFPKAETKIHLKRTEAIAFMCMYKKNYIEQTLETAQIAHTIDRTL